MTQRIELFRGRDSARLVVRLTPDGRIANTDRLVKFLTRKAPKTGNMAQSFVVFVEET